MVDEAEKVPVKSGAKTRLSSAEEAWQPIARFRDEVDRLFDDFVGRIGGFPFGWRGLPADSLRAGRFFGGSVPAVDLVEKEGGYALTAELPGLSESDVELTLADDILTIKGEKKEEKEDKGTGYQISERRYGMFRRSFPLPDDVDAEKIAATFKKGVLTVELPKRPGAESKEKKIAIKPE